MGSRHERVSVRVSLGRLAVLELVLAIRLPNGELICDPEWECVADVMRSAHGQGVTRMPGELIELEDPQ